MADITNLSDEEIMNMETLPADMVPEAEETLKTTEEEVVTEEPQTEEVVEETTDPVEEEPTAETTEEPAAEETPASEKDEPVKEEVTEEPVNPLETPDEEEETDKKSEEPTKEEPKKEEAAKSEEPVKDSKDDKKVEEKTGKVDEIDYKAAYEGMLSFRANGKDIKLSNPEEAVRLMQMGANYTKKLQQLTPNLKLVKMLENNDLLDEGKLSFMIDLNKKDPAAIQKFLRDGNIDPMDIDTSLEPTYTPSNHSVSDAQMNFDRALEDTASTQSGQALLVDINSGWDQASKDAIYGDPSVLPLLAQQKESGIYDIVSAEVEKRRMLGQVNGMSSIQAYQAVGQALQAEGRLTPPQQEPVNVDPAPSADPTPVQENRVVETRPAPRKAPVENSAQVKAAAPVKTTAKKVQSNINPLTMSDEDFENAAGFAGKI